MCVDLKDNTPDTGLIRATDTLSPVTEVDDMDFLKKIREDAQKNRVERRIPQQHPSGKQKSKRNMAKASRRKNR